MLVMACRGGHTKVGGLGVVTLATGYYLYAGSAQRGLRSRVSRHLGPVAHRHWHIDYVKGLCRPVGVALWAGRGADECALSDAVGECADGCVPGFGCTDCRCRSHLHYVADGPFERLNRLGIDGLRVVRFTDV